MSDKDKIEGLQFVIVLVAILGTALGFMCGVMYGITLSERDAIRNNAATYIADEYGIAKFKWKDIKP